MKFKEKLNQAAGFTLVELIVVIAILAILAGVAVPAYSGYIEKANLAADQQLLAAVNKAFAAACAENGTDPYQLADGSVTLTIEGENGARTVKEVSLYNEEFARYFAGNYTAVFKVFTYLKYENGTFVPGDSVFSNILGSLSAEDIQAFIDSGFMNVGVAELMGKVDFVTQFGVSMMDDINSSFTELVMSEEHMAYMAQVLGVIPNEGQTVGEAVEAAVYQMAVNKTGQTSGDELDQAIKEIYVNNMVLYAAENTVKKDTIMSMFTTPGKTPMDVIRADMSAGGSTSNAAALGQAAALYGMYTTYVQTLDPNDPEQKAIIDAYNESDDILSLLNTINSTDTGEGSFAHYMNSEQGSKDLDAYLAAMNMITSSSSDSEAVANLLANGFTDPDLIAMLNQATTSSSSGN